MKPLTEKIAMIIANRLEVGGWDKCDENKRNLYRHIVQAALEELKFEQLVAALKRARFDLHSLGVEAYGDYPTETVDEMDALLSELEKTE